MFLPVVKFEDGYGFSYGARFAKPARSAAASQMSFSLTWGGTARRRVRSTRPSRAAL